MHSKNAMLRVATATASGSRESQTAVSHTQSLASLPPTTQETKPRVCIRHIIAQLPVGVRSVDLLNHGVAGLAERKQKRDYARAVVAWIMRPMPIFILLFLVLSSFHVEALSHF